MRHRLSLGLALALVLMPQAAWGEAFVRILTQRARVRTGPSPNYRVIYVAERGDVLPVKERSTQDYWFRVELDDGSTGWVFGEQVMPFDVVEDDDPGFFGGMWRGIRRAILAPSPVPYSDVELSFSAGVLGEEGMFLFRPAWLIDQYFALEAFAGESPRKQETLFLAGLGWTLRLIPGGSLGPYAHLGAGVAHFRPKEDAFTLEKRTLMTVNAGGGFELTLKGRITIRADVRHWVFFDPEEIQDAQEVTGGLAIFF